MTETLARIDERQKNHDSFLKKIQRQTEATHDRVGQLERWRTWMVGLSVGVNGVLAAILSGVALVGQVKNFF